MQAGPQLHENRLFATDRYSGRKYAGYEDES